MENIVPILNHEIDDYFLMPLSEFLVNKTLRSKVISYNSFPVNYISLNYNAKMEVGKCHQLIHIHGTAPHVGMALALAILQWKKAVNLAPSIEASYLNVSDALQYFALIASFTSAV